MEKGRIKINQYATSENTVESVVCFKKFIDFLEDKVQTDKSIRVHFYQFVLNKIKHYPELIRGIQVSDVTKYDEILELVSTIVLPLIDDEDEALVGLTSGLSPEVFYATKAFVKLFDSRPDIATDQWMNKEASLKLHKQIQYYLILQKVYGYTFPQKREILHSFSNPVTGLYQYFRLHIDTRFVEVKTKSKDTAVSPHSISACVQFTDTGEEIEKLFPLSNYIASGFSIITLTDITTQQAVEQMSKIATNIDKKNTSNDFVHMTRLLQTIVGSNHYQFGIMPFFTINNRAALLYENFPYSLVITASFSAGINKKIFTRYINHYIKDPQVIIYDAADTKNTLPIPVQEALKGAGIHYYVLAPVYFNDELVGILESGAGPGIPPLTDFQMGKLKPAVPYISQLLKRLIDKFNISIDSIVKDKFTVIQPSVQWKFNEVAWHYFRSDTIEHRGSTLEKISFKHVYPLYGAVDIRNSTIERNRALREDLQLQLELLLNVLNRLDENGHAGETTVIIETCRQWKAKLAAYISIEDELELNEFLFSTAYAFLAAQTNLSAAVSKELADYYDAIVEETGSTFNKRRALERSIKLLNKTIGKHFDLFKEDLRHFYPCYFEKFRTDGIEYDVYIGQSIAPKIPFSLSDVEKLRMWQVQSMATITKLTHTLLGELENPLQTTQLIFVNARTIDISFRNDERRFDVEGAYNIRYHIIKKRIDKVNIRGSFERLTQPGKIAIVYFNEKDAAEYISYIKQLQQQRILQYDLEHLELEELQGVTGLKALRVGVAMD